MLLNRGDGSFQAKLDYATGTRPDSVAIGDLNGDGKPDLATANAYASTVSVLANRGDGSFEAKRDYATGSGPVSVAIGDLNGDGKPDLAAITANARSDTVSVLANATGLCGCRTSREDAAGREAHDRAGGLPRREDPPRLLEVSSEGRVISQKPRPGTVLPIGSKVNLVVSRGRKR